MTRAAPSPIRTAQTTALGSKLRAGAIALAAAAGLASGASAQTKAPACGGEDLFTRLEVERPEAAAALRAAADAQPDAEGRFWRIDREGLPPSWLFGTFHSTEADVATPPPAVTETIERARVVFTEITPAEQAEMQTAIRSNPALVMDFEGGTLDDLLDPAQREMAERVFLSYGMPYETAKRFRPWFVQVLTAQPPCAIAAMQSGRKVLDVAVSDLAAEKGVPVMGLESWEESIAVFADQNEEEQRAGLLLSLAMAERSEDFLRTAIDLYLQGETMLIWEFGRHVAREAAEIDDADALNARFWDEVVVERNDRFLEAAAPELEKGGAFLAVGALHLGGEGGMLGKLRGMGYETTRLPLE
jgi:uncharacterized protein